MMKYKLQKDFLSSCSKVCGMEPGNSDLNVFHQDGTIEIHHTFLNYVLEIYNKIEIEIKEVKAN
jgi:hypothetical protein